MRMLNGIICHEHYLENQNYFNCLRNELHDTKQTKNECPVDVTITAPFQKFD